MAQFNLIEFRYVRKHQPEQYGAEEVSIGGTAIVEAGEDAFALADGLIGRAKAVAYNRLGLKPTRECGAADLSAVKVTRVPSAEQQQAAPVVAAAGPDLSLPGVTAADIKAAAAESFPAGDELPGTEGEQPAKRGVGRPKGSGTGKRTSKAEKDAAAAALAASAADALPGEETPAVVVDSLPGAEPAAEQSEEDALMALLNQGEAPAAPASAEAEIDNAALMAACAEAARDKKAGVVTAYLKQVGVDRVLKLDQAQRRALVAQIAK